MTEEERTYLVGEYGMESWPTIAVLEFGYNKGFKDGVDKVSAHAVIEKKEEVELESSELIEVPFERDKDAEKANIEKALKSIDFEEIALFRRSLKLVAWIDADVLRQNAREQLITAFDRLEQVGAIVEKCNNNPLDDIYYYSLSSIFDTSAGYTYDADKKMWVPNYFEISYNLQHYNSLW